MEHEPARILIVDDHRPSAELLTACLGDLGFSVSTAEDGSRAISMTAEQRFDLVILDGRMPGYDGCEVLRVLRSQQGPRPLKVLAVTGDTTEEMRSALTALGVDGYLNKPLDLGELVNVVRKLLGETATSGA